MLNLLSTLVIAGAIATATMDSGEVYTFPVREKYYEMVEDANYDLENQEDSEIEITSVELYARYDDDLNAYWGVCEIVAICNEDTIEDGIEFGKGTDLIVKEQVYLGEYCDWDEWELNDQYVSLYAGGMLVESEVY